MPPQSFSLGFILGVNEGDGTSFIFSHLQALQSMPLGPHAAWQSEAVLMDVSKYENIQERLELLTDVQTALGQLAGGQGVSHGDAKREVMKRVKK